MILVRFLVYAIFFFAFFGNLFVDYKLLPSYVTLATEGFVFFLFVISFVFKNKEKPYRFDLWYIFLFLLVASICSSIVNGTLFSLKPVVGLRLVFRFYFFYLALINLNLSESDIVKINRLLILLFLVQLPAQAIRFSYLGISELTIGTWGSHGGGLTPIIPVVAIGYLVGFFSFYKKKVIYIFLMVAFVFFGIVGEKRVLFLVYPLSFLGMYLAVLKVREKKNLLFSFVSLIMIMCVGLGVSAVMLKSIRTLNPEHIEGGKGSINFSYALDYTKKYTTAKTGDIGHGRLATTVLVFETLYNAGLPKIFFGFGPGSLTKSALGMGMHYNRKLYKIAASYGLTGLAYIAVEYGLIGVAVILAMLIIIVRRYRRWYLSGGGDGYWKAISFGGYIFSIYISFIFISYNRVPLTDDLITPVFYYAMALPVIMARI